MTVVRLSVRAPRGMFTHWVSLFGLSVVVHLGVLLGVIVLPRVFRPRLKFPEVYSVNLVSLPAGAPGPSQSGPPAEKASAPAPAPPAPTPKPAPAPPPKAKAEPAIKIPMKPTVKPPKQKQVAKVAPPPRPKEHEKPKDPEPKAESSGESQESAEKAAPTSQQAAGGGGEGSGAAGQGAGVQGAGTGGAGGSGGMVDDPAFQFGWYVSNIQSIVSRNWSQPILQDIRASLVAVVHFRVHKDGRVDEIVLERSSGDSVLDRSAVRALQDSNPLPPLPYQWSKESIGFRFEFEIHPD